MTGANAKVAPMARGSPEERVEALARAQHGVFSRDQALDVGVPRWVWQQRVEAGRWERVHPGVFRPAGVPRTWESDLMAAVLWSAPHGVVSHRAAARVWAMEGIEKAPVEISSRIGCRRDGTIVHRLRAADTPVRRVVHGFPVTEPARTLLDLAGVLPAGRVGVAVDDALRRGIVGLADLREVLEREGGRGRKGTTSLRRLLDVRTQDDERMESVLEQQLFRLLRRAGLPLPVPQYEVRGRDRLLARLDFAYPEEKLAVETHGYRWHGRYERWRKDIRRENALKRLGWLVLVFTWDDVQTEPWRVVSEVREALASVGSAPTSTVLERTTRRSSGSSSPT